MTRKIACITLDVETDFHDPGARLRLFDDASLFARYTALVNEHDVKLTAFLVTSLLDQYGADYKKLAGKIPVEFAVHSHRHDMQNPCSRTDIEESVRAFRDFFGKNPDGYRAPVGQITREGMETLLDLGFRYDSSIYPSVRPGRPGYNNLHLPVAPFRVRRAANSIIEVPFGTLSGIRLVFSLSYVKLFGWKTYQFLLKMFPLPDQLAVLSHPYDHYFHLLPDATDGWEKPLLQRNAENAFDLLEKMIIFLRRRGYEFEFLSGLCDYLEDQDLPVYDVERAIR
ncbi:MAG TPA: polysaccharide deacetylase family protein [Anaerolineales bacterium]|nr:polysaccharide deacetylase family protein [Anaerolineales bacterium]